MNTEPPGFTPSAVVAEIARRLHEHDLLTHQNELYRHRDAQLMTTLACYQQALEEIRDQLDSVWCSERAHLALQQRKDVL